MTKLIINMNDCMDVNEIDISPSPIKIKIDTPIPYEAYEYIV